jgi:hypothetical protein
MSLTGIYIGLALTVAALVVLRLLPLVGNVRRTARRSGPISVVLLAAGTVTAFLAGQAGLDDRGDRPWRRTAVFAVVSLVCLAVAAVQRRRRPR